MSCSRFGPTKHHQLFVRTSMGFLNKEDLASFSRSFDRTHINFNRVLYFSITNSGNFHGNPFLETRLQSQWSSQLFLLVVRYFNVHLQCSKTFSYQNGHFFSFEIYKTIDFCLQYLTTTPDNNTWQLHLTTTPDNYTWQLHPFVEFKRLLQYLNVLLRIFYVYSLHNTHVFIQK